MTLVLLAGAVRADEGVIAGVEIGAATPVGKFKNRTDTGGTISPFVGYMFTPILGLVGEAQFTGFPNDDRSGTNDPDATLTLGAHAGPRLALPFRLGDVQLEPYGTFQAGVFTGLEGNTAISHTSWGLSSGGGLNVRLTDDLLFGGFARYNRLDQRVESGRPVEYVTAGLALTFNPAVTAAPAPVAAPPAEAPPVKRKIVLRGVHFDFDKATIRPEAKPVLDEAIGALKQAGNVTILTEGHTDSIGSAEYNQRLSERRARAVRDYMVSGGIAPSRIESVGMGESKPVASNDTAEGRAENRRVELRVRKK
jgi:outer membrane protein OmpA-like peptidoglycan-associated protein